MNKTFKKMKLLPVIAYILLQLSFSSFAQTLNAEVTVNNNPSEDYLFLALSFGGGAHLWIVDNELTPIFYKRVTGGAYDFKYQPNGELTYNIYSIYSYGMDSSGSLVNQYFTPPGFALDIHDLTVLEDGSYYILGRDHITIDMSQYVTGGDTAAVLVAHTIHHMDANDNELWRWNSFDHYDIVDVDNHVDLTLHTVDWTHCNSVEVDNDGNIILSTRNFNEITKINRQTGEIIWRLGGKKNQFQFINDTRGFGRQHDARRHSNGNLILFDNGHYLIPQYSSFVEYDLDEDSLTATLVRRYSRDESIFTLSRGGVQELPNDNTLISWGENINPYITEINTDDSIEFELVLPSLVHKYRAYRFPWQTNYFFVNTDSLNFGSVSVGDSSTQNLWLINRKDTSIVINEFYLNDSTFSVLDTLPISIPQNDSVKITIMYKPESDVYSVGKLNVRYTAVNFLLGKQVKLVGQTPLTSVEEDSEQLSDYFLFQNYPNPFNPITNIRFRVAESGFVTLKVYDILGNELVTLVNDELSVGEYEVELNTSSIKHLPSSGIYFYQLKAGNFVQTKKLVLLK
jgi:hypothetical protein